MDCLRLIKFFNDIGKDVMLSDLLDCVLSAQLINMSENKKEWLKMEIINIDNQERINELESILEKRFNHYFSIIKYYNLYKIYFYKRDNLDTDEIAFISESLNKFNFKYMEIGFNDSKKSIYVLFREMIKNEWTKL